MWSNSHAGIRRFNGKELAGANHAPFCYLLPVEKNAVIAFKGTGPMRYQYKGAPQ